MENNQNNSIVEMTQNLLGGLSFKETDDMRSTIKEFGETIVQRLSEDPIHTLGVAFSVGFAAVELLKSPGKEMKKKLANAAGAALVYGFLNPIIKSTTLSSPQNDSKLH